MQYCFELNPEIDILLTEPFYVLIFVIMGPVRMNILFPRLRFS